MRQITFALNISVFLVLLLVLTALCRATVAQNLLQMGLPPTPPYTQPDPAWAAMRRSLRQTIHNSSSAFNGSLFAAIDRRSLASNHLTWVEFAIDEHNSTAAIWLLEHGFRPEGRQVGDSSIITAVEAHQDGVIPYLIRYGADPKRNIYIGMPGYNPSEYCQVLSPLDVALADGDASAAENILSSGVRTDKLVPPNDETPLLVDAANTGSAKLVGLLLKDRLPNENWSTTEINVIAWTAPSPLVKSRLIPVGATYWESPLIAAIAEPILARLNSSPMYIGQFGQNPILLFASALLDAGKSIKLPQERREIVKMLISAGFSARQRFTDQPLTPLFFAIACDDVETVHLLTGHGAMIDPIVPSDSLALQAWQKRHPTDPLPVFQF